MINLNVFSQILSLIDRELFKDLVSKHKSDKHQKGINSWTHLVSMLFCHFSSADSVRDISNGLRSTTGNEYHFLTNNTKWKASLVAKIYKQRWHIEVFFKHLKQRLKVSTFIGTSENAVMIQIWTSLIGILLLKYLQKKAKYDWNLSNLVAFIRMNIFVKINIWQWIDDPFLRPPIKGKKGQIKIFAD